MTDQKARLLIVDDNPSITDSICALLTRKGYAVEAALNGTSALRKIMDNDFDIIICDIEMPGMSGLDLLEKIRLDSRIQEVILMTGILDTDYFIRAIRLGASDFISKPVDLHQLQKSIETVMDKIKSRDNRDSIFHFLDFAQMNCEINPCNFTGLSFTKMVGNFLIRNLKLPHTLMNEVLICVDEMLYNAFIHGILGLSYEEREYETNELQLLISDRLSQLHISSRRIRMSLTMDNLKDHILICVEDDGDGFDYERWLKKITTEKQLNLEGHGRGLTMLYHLTNSMSFSQEGRRIEVTLKPNAR
jgi:CheY-like chemotaxis protein/anti-sigma regulatory factor (Ser/Thr protein kinase)